MLPMSSTPLQPSVNSAGAIFQYFWGEGGVGRGQTTSLEGQMAIMEPWAHKKLGKTAKFEGENVRGGGAAETTGGKFPLYVPMALQLPVKHFSP